MSITSKVLLGNSRSARRWATRQEPVVCRGPDRHQHARPPPGEFRDRQLGELRDRQPLALGEFRDRRQCDGFQQSRESGSQPGIFAASLCV